jgi:hypothetical protein
MKKITIIAIAFVLSIGILYAQKPEEVLSIADVYKPHEWYLAQAELWWKEIQKDKKNETAWYNYFMANRMARFDYDCKGDNSKKYYEETKFLMNPDSLVALAQKNIPNTFTGHFIIWRNSGSDPSNFTHLEKAYALNPNFTRINSEMVCYHESQYDLAKRKEYNKKWHQLKELSSGFLAYSYNVLMTIKPNGAIISFGDNDTFPIWMLQDALGIREDVTVLNVSLLCNPEYRSKIFKKLNIAPYKGGSPEGATPTETENILKHIIKNKPSNLPLYVGLTAWKQFEKYSEKFYLVGLALEYSNANIDNIALLKNNFENIYALDYIKNSFMYDISNEIVNKTNLNYLPAIFKLYEHYTLSGDITHANKMRDLGLTIAQKGGQDWFDKAKSILK